MSTSKLLTNDEKDDDQRLVTCPLEYVKKTRECICGWCGQVLISSHTTDDLETHFKSCKNTKENGLITILKELRKVQHNFQAEIGKIKRQINTVKDEMLAEIIIKADHLRMKTEFNNGILSLKIVIKSELESSNKDGENHDGALDTFYNRVEVLEETMREMNLVHETRMAEMNERFCGVSETLTSAVHDVLEGAGAKEVTSSVVNHELDRLKRVTESMSQQMRTNCKEFQMNCFNLVTYNYNGQPNLSWTIDEIEDKLERETFQVGSEMFQWNGYPVQARAKLQLKEDGCVYISLRLEENAALKDVEREPKDITLIPQVYYLLNCRNVRVCRRKCNCTGYLTSSAFSFSLDFELCLGQKEWLLNSMYTAKDSIQLEIYVEPLALAQRAHSFDGALEWSIRNYATRLESEQKGFVPYQESPCFYTSPRGYRVQVRLSLKGFDGERGPIAQILFFTGEFDAELPKSFPHSTTVTLVDRKEPQKNMSKTIVEDIKDKKYYDLEICTMKEVENFIEDNTLLLEVSIKSH